jgi:hypothetical protein
MSEKPDPGLLDGVRLLFLSTRPMFPSEASLKVTSAVVRFVAGS